MRKHGDGAPRGSRSRSSGRRMDRDQIEQALINVLTNAREATAGDDGVIHK